MIKGSQINKGTVVIFNKEPYKVMELRRTMSGRGSNTISCKMRHILSGIWQEHRYKTDDKVEKAFIEKREYEYLYADGEEHWFMDLENYEQISMKEEEISDVLGYMLPNTKVHLQIYDEKAIGCEVPKLVHLKVEATEPGIKGATVSGNVTKPATLETGIIVQVPMFIANDEVVIINTESGDYSGREQ